jgi:hypothetical protein
VLALGTWLGPIIGGLIVAIGVPVGVRWRRAACRHRTDFRFMVDLRRSSADEEIAGSQPDAIRRSTGAILPPEQQPQRSSSTELQQ